MRPIKFRVWDASSGQLTMVNHIRFSESDHSQERVGACLVEGNGNKNLSGKIDGGRTRAFVLMQYTGLKDKNGVEIYEGDIVEIFTGSNDDYRGVVEFEHGSFWAMTEQGERGEGWSFADIFGNFSRWNAKVIGNIYEHPELLEKAA